MLNWTLNGADSKCISALAIHVGDSIHENSFTANKILFSHEVFQLISSKNIKLAGIQLNSKTHTGFIQLKLRYSNEPVVSEM